MAAVSPGRERGAMSTLTEHKVKTSLGAELYARVEGEGPTILFIAGLGDDTESWTRQVEAFRSRYRCITFDNRGIGRSSVPAGDYSTQQMADEAHEVLAELGGGPAVVIGSSMGGQIAQQLTLRHPDDVSVLVLSNTWGEKDFFIGHAVTHWRDLATRGLKRQLIDELLLFNYSPDYMVAHPEAVEEFLAMEIPDLTGFLNAGAACIAAGQYDELPSIDKPTLVIAGRQDIICRPQLSERIASQIPGAQLRYMDTAHMPFWERPDEWEAIVDEFLSAHADRIG